MLWIALKILSYIFLLQSLILASNIKGNDTDLKKQKPYDIVNVDTLDSVNQRSMLGKPEEKDIKIKENVLRNDNSKYYSQSLRTRSRNTRVSNPKLNRRENFKLRITNGKTSAGNEKELRRFSERLKFRSFGEKSWKNLPGLHKDSSQNRRRLPEKNRRHLKLHFANINKQKDAETMDPKSKKDNSIKIHSKTESMNRYPVSKTKANFRPKSSKTDSKSQKDNFFKISSEIEPMNPLPLSKTKPNSRSGTNLILNGNMTTSINLNFNDWNLKKDNSINIPSKTKSMNPLYVSKNNSNISNKSIKTNLTSNNNMTSINLDANDWTLKNQDLDDSLEIIQKIEHILKLLQNYKDSTTTTNIFSKGIAKLISGSKVEAENFKSLEKQKISRFKRTKSDFAPKWHWIVLFTFLVLLKIVFGIWCCYLVRKKFFSKKTEIKNVSSFYSYQLSDDESDDILFESSDLDNHKRINKID